MKSGWLTWGIGLLLIACGPAASGGGPMGDGAVHHDQDSTEAGQDATSSGADAHSPGDSSQSSVCGSTPSQLTGRVFAPNGTDPIPGALVYIVQNTQTFPPPAATVQCQMCVTPPAAIAQTTSGSDGSFTLTGGVLDTGGTFTVVLESGGFRHVERNVTVGMCTPLALTATQTSFPGANNGDDTIPSILVAWSTSTSSSGTTYTNVNDDITKVLMSIGITGYSTVDPDHATPFSMTNDLVSVMSNMATLSQYQIIFVPCGSLGNWGVAANITPAMISNMQTWLGMGGRLYASDLAYSIINLTYPGAITFAPGPSAHTPGDPADVGVGITTSSMPNASIMANVDDESLRNWLTGVGVLASGATSIPVMDLKDPWGAIGSVPDSELMGTTGPSGVVLVSANVSWHSGTTTTAAANHPLTVMVDYAAPGGQTCGRVVFTSYHVQSSTSGPLTPQERVLEYLFFRLTTCIDTPG